MAKGGWKEKIGEPHQFVGIKVGTTDLQQLDDLATDVGRTRSALIREAINRYIESEVAA